MTCDGCRKQNTFRRAAQAARGMVQAATNTISNPEKTKERVAQRKAICQQCPDGEYRCSPEGYAPRCNACGCMLVFKWPSDDSCCLGHW